MVNCRNCLPSARIVCTAIRPLARGHCAGVCAEEGMVWRGAVVECGDAAITVMRAAMPIEFEHDRALSVAHESEYNTAPRAQIAHERLQRAHKILHQPGFQPSSLVDE